MLSTQVNQQSTTVIMSLHVIVFPICIQFNIVMENVSLSSADVLFNEMNLLDNDLYERGE